MSTDYIIPKKSEIKMIETVEDGKKLEGKTSAAVAYYYEQRDYENYMKAWQAYVLSRRRTTELCLKERNGNVDVTLSELGFTKMQWSRRLKEYRIPVQTLDAYFDSIVASGWQPSINGLLRDAAGEELDRFAVAVAELKRGAWKLANEYRDRTTDYQRKVLASVLDAFAEAE